MTVQVATLGSKTWDWGLLLTGLPLCVATRAANIFPLSRLANLRRKLPLPRNLQVDTRVSHLRSCTWALVRKKISHLGITPFRCRAWPTCARSCPCRTVSCLCCSQQSLGTSWINSISACAV